MCWVLGSASSVGVALVATHSFDVNFQQPVRPYGIYGLGTVANTGVEGGLSAPLEFTAVT